MKSCLVIAGEKSGEDHCLSFFPELKSFASDTNFYGVGGDQLQSHGMDLLYHIKDFSSWGISEVVKKVPFYFEAQKKILEEVDKRQTKVAILIDFQEFNFMLAKKLKKRGVTVLYYVAPQAWAWRPWRAKALSKFAHTLFVLLPFEKQWFQKRGVKNVIQVTHPVITENREKLKFSELNSVNTHFFNTKELNLLLLPGSRNFEVQSLLPEFLRSVDLLKKYYKVNLSVVKTSSVKKEHYAALKNYEYNEYDAQDLHKALAWADASLAASGTVTLTCGLYQVPTIVCYKATLLTELVYDIFGIYNGPASLANIMLGERCYPELIQQQAYAEKMVRSLRIWLENKDQYQSVVNKLQKIQDLALGDDLDVAKYMAEVIKKC